MDYVFLGKTLPFDRVTGRLLFTDDRVQLSDVEGALFGGAVRGNADISLARKVIPVIRRRSRWRESISRG